MLQSRKHMIPHNRLHKFTRSSAHQAGIHVELADRPDSVSMRFAAAKMVMSMDGNASEVIEMFCGHVCASVVGLDGDANVIYEEEIVSEEDSVRE